MDVKQSFDDLKAANTIFAREARLLNENKTDTGLIVAEGFDYEIIDKAFKSFDDLTIYMKLCCDGTVKKNIVGSIVESLRVDPENVDYEVLKELFRKPSLQIAQLFCVHSGGG